MVPQMFGSDVKVQVNGSYIRSQPAPCTLNVTFAFTTYFRKNDELMIVATGSPLKVGADLDAFKDKGLGGMAAEKIRRKLVELEGKTLGLELTLQIRALSFAWNAKCIFELIPISLDRVDIVEAKLRDVEEELARTKKRLADQNAKGVMYLAASSEIVDVVSDKEEIIWKDLISGHFELNSEQNGIIFLEGAGTL
ncbi:hypothetical protein GQ600_24329 [Phytophthora cactorum]|nr:hypothetical protein GQ600_24329 [Phytophthora cactorum]